MTEHIKRTELSGNKRVVAYVHNGDKPRQKADINYLKKNTDIEIIKLYEEAAEIKGSERPELLKALRYCQKKGATLLLLQNNGMLNSFAVCTIIFEHLANYKIKTSIWSWDSSQKLDLGLIEISVKTLMALAMQHSKHISERTKLALANARERGVVLGAKPKVLKKATDLAKLSNRKNAQQYYESVYPIINKIQQAGGESLRDIATGLTERNVLTRRGKAKWNASQVKNVLDNYEVQK